MSNPLQATQGTFSLFGGGGTSSAGGPAAASTSAAPKSLFGGSSFTASVPTQGSGGSIFGSAIGGLSSNNATDKPFVGGLFGSSCPLNNASVAATACETTVSSASKEIQSSVNCNVVTPGSSEISGTVTVSNDAKTLSKGGVFGNLGGSTGASDTKGAIAFTLDANKATSAAGNGTDDSSAGDSAVASTGANGGMTPVVLSSGAAKIGEVSGDNLIKGGAKNRQPVAASAKSKNSPEHIALETMQHERIDDVLSNWERRIQKKINRFDELALEVASVESSLVSQAKILAGVRQNQERISKRQLLVSESISRVEQEQQDLIDLLKSIQRNLAAKLSVQEQRGLRMTMEQSMSQRVLEMDGHMDELATALSKVAYDSQPEPIATISQVLAMHQAALNSAAQQCNHLDALLKTFHEQKP